MTTTERADAPTFRLEGDEVTIPVVVRSAKMVAAQFLVDADAAQRLIDYSGLLVARQMGGKAMLALSAIAYADNDLGPYHEFAVALVVEPHDAVPGAKSSWNRPTTLIHRLPVNQEFTCKVGKGLWGFPKWVCDIDYVDRDRRTDCVVTDDGELAVALEVSRGLVPLPGVETEMRAYAWDDGILRRTPWTTRNRLVRGRLRGAEVRLGPNHPMADELRSLGLPAKPLITTTVGVMSATFGAPEVVESSRLAFSIS
jgi:Acetoacetate decarboxylase (ADC)